MGPQTLRARRVRHRNSDGRAARGSTPLGPLRCWAHRREQPRSPQSGDARATFMSARGFRGVPALGTPRYCITVPM